MRLSQGPSRRAALSGQLTAATPPLADRANRLWSLHPLLFSNQALSQKNGAGRVTIEGHRRCAMQERHDFGRIVGAPGKDAHEMERSLSCLPHGVLPGVELRPVTAHGDHHEERKTCVHLEGERVDAVANTAALHEECAAVSA